MNNIVIRNIEPQEIKIGGGGEVIGITKVYVNGEDVTIGSSAYVIVPTKTSELINDSGYITNESDPTVPSYVKAISLADIQNWDNKQQALVSGTNIKTINGNSILGSGNLNVSTSYSAGTGIEITEENVINNIITSYDDLTDLPTIPTKTSDLLNDSDYVVSSSLSEVAFNGSYLALSDTPDSTSDFTNDGEDGVHPYITNETDSLVNYYDKDFIYNLLPKVSDEDTVINLNPSYSSKLKIELKATELSQDGTPTPSSPQAVHTISGSNKVVVNGKNLIGLGIQCNGYVDADTLLFENTISSAQNSVGYYFKTSTLPNTITFSNVGGNRANVCYFNEIPNDEVVCVLRDTSNSNPRTITINKTYPYIHLQLSYNNTSVSNIQVEAGSTVTEYEPYVSQEADIDLDTIEYCKIGNYEDKFIRSNDGTWQLEKNIGKSDMGEMNWIYGTGRLYSLDLTSIINKNDGANVLPNNILCNVYSKITPAVWYAKTTLGISVGGNGYGDDGSVLIYDSNYTNATTFKTDMAGNYIYYGLITPTYTPITGTLAEQLENIYYNLTSYNEQTNISQVNTDLPFTISASTLKDISSL